MKTIEVTDEQYEFLKEAQNLIKTQNNRSTRDPIYVVMSRKKVYGMDSEYSEEYGWYNDDQGFDPETNEELFENLMEEDCLQDLIDIHNNEEESVILDSDENACKLWFLAELEENICSSVEDFIESKGYRKVYYTYEEKISTSSNIFSLFEADAVDFVKSKCYDVDNGNKNDIWSYADSSWRSVRMNKVRDLLTTIKLGESYV